MKWLPENLTDFFLPDYRRRHIFTTKLRLLAFVGFWGIFLFFMKDVIGQLKSVVAIVFACFFATSFAYYNIIRGRWLALSFTAELASDLLAITVVLYLTGGPYSPYFTIYLFYIFVAGAIYNHYLAGFVAFLSAAFYGAFLLACLSGIIPPLILDYGDKLPIPSYTPLANFAFASIFGAIVVYTVKVAIYFSQERERALEKRNRELMALHKVSSAVKSMVHLRGVIDRILTGVLDGLSFESVILVHFDKEGKNARVYSPGRHPKLAEIEKMLGHKVDGFEVPVRLLESPALREIMNHRLIFRRNLSEIFCGFSDFVTSEQCDRIQALMNVKRIVAVPLIVERTVIGALIGFSREPFLEGEQVATLESFANHAAISIEAASLIETLRSVNEKLKEANRVKSEFLAMMSHELRTPLTAIIGFSELLIEGVMGELTEEQRESLEEVLHNAAELLDLINSLLDLTKVESDRMALDVNSYRISETVKRVVSMISPLVQKKRQTLDTSFADAGRELKGDEKKIQQVILNLLANANKFTGEGGLIRVHTQFFDTLDDLIVKCGAEGRFSDRVDDGRGWVVITVSDNGIGIPEGHHEKIFEMFHQADSSVTRSFGGTGLGLSLARRFVEMHGGDIWVESRPGEGAKFTVAMPVVVEATGQ
jgi:signal transduction histidine kinase